LDIVAHTRDASIGLFDLRRALECWFNETVGGSMTDPLFLALQIWLHQQQPTPAI